MAKVDFRKLSKGELSRLETLLMTALKELGMKDNAWELLRLLITESEIVMLARRLQIVRRLLKGVSALEISIELHIGLPTIYVVDRSLQQTFKDYKSVLLPILEEQEQKGGRKEKIPLAPHSFRAFRKHYPAYALLFNVLLGNPEMYEELDP